MKTSKFAVWWVSQAACDAIGDILPRRFPKYLRDQYRSRLGRPGRCRLWAEPKMNVSIDPWPETPFSKWIENEDCGGIVVELAHAELLRDLPGVVTDLKLQRLFQ